MLELSNVQTFRTSDVEDGVAPPPAYFLSLTVENIRSFGPRQTLDLSDGDGRPALWTIILGDNGFGKTTLLQCLAALQPVRSKAGVTSGLQHDQAPFMPLYTSNARDRLYLKEKLLRSLPAYLSCSVFLNTESINYSVDFKTKIASSDEEEKVDLPELQVIDQTVVEGMCSLISYGYGAARRQGNGALSENSEQSTTASLFEDDAPLINAEEWYLQADYAAHRSKSRKAARQRDQIKQALINILPDVNDIRIAEPKGSQLSAHVEVKTPFGWVHIQSLSLGYRTLIAWVVDLAHRLFERYPKSKNPLAEPAVVLVDEIDLHLHPRFQRKLMDYLTELFPNAQFIATAHSPLVVQAASNANIALLRREGDHVVIDNDVESIKNWRVDQILTSELFGLETARPPQIDGLMAERTRLLSKSRLTKADKARLQVLEAEIGDLPTSETPDDIEAMDIIRQAAKLLKSE